MFAAVRIVGVWSVDAAASLRDGIEIGLNFDLPDEDDDDDVSS